MDKTVFLPTMILISAAMLSFPTHAQITGKDSTYQVNTSTYPDVDMEPWVDPNDNPQVEQGLLQENQDLLDEQEAELTVQGNAEHNTQQAETGTSWNNFESVQEQKICDKYEALELPPPPGYNCTQP